eukprot:scaffold2553_cov162-Skeletonema_marinoi.AAC.10
MMWVLVLLLLLRLRRCGALPPCSRLDWRSCWLNNSLLRPPPHSGRHAWTWLSRCKGSHIPPSIIIASIHSTTTKNEESKRWTLDLLAWMRSS